MFCIFSYVAQQLITFPPPDKKRNRVPFNVLMFSHSWNDDVFFSNKKIYNRMALFMSNKQQRKHMFQNKIILVPHQIHLWKLNGTVSVKLLINSFFGGVLYLPLNSLPWSLLGASHLQMKWCFPYNSSPSNSRYNQKFWTSEQAVLATFVPMSICDCASVYILVCI